MVSQYNLHYLVSNRFSRFYNWVVRRYHHEKLENPDLRKKIGVHGLQNPERINGA